MAQKGHKIDHLVVNMIVINNIQIMQLTLLIFQLEDVRLEQSDPSDLTKRSLSDNHKSFRSQLEQRPLRFAFQDGSIKELCASEDEPEWVLNVKRGVLSSFQNSMEHFDDDHKVTEVSVL